MRHPVIQEDKLTAPQLLAKVQSLEATIRRLSVDVRESESRAQRAVRSAEDAWRFVKTVARLDDRG